MKKSIWLVVLLTIVSIGILGTAIVVMDQKKEVVLTERTLYGDKNAAQGLELELNVNSENRLHWNIRHQFGTGETETIFKFGERHAKDSPNWLWGDDEGIRVGLGMRSLTSMSNNNAERFASYYEDSGHKELVQKLVQGAIERTETGERHSELIYLKEYMDVYPIVMDSSYNIGEIDLNKFREYFQIPIQEQYGIRITIEKDENGTIRSISLNNGEMDNPQIENFTVKTENGCFFTFQEMNGNSRLFNISRLPAYGVYYIPYTDYISDTGERSENGKHLLSFEDMQVVYPMNSLIRLEQLALSRDKSHIYLLVQDCGILKFIAINAKTVQITQMIDLMNMPEGTSYAPFNLSYEYDDFIAVHTAGNKIFIIEKTEDGRFEHVLTADVQDILDMGVCCNWTSRAYYNHTEWKDEDSNTTMAWDGERLAITSFRWNNQYFCHFDLAVYDQSGLLYCGEYRNSLNFDQEINSYLSYKACRPDETDIWSLSWQ